jgi:hypothetical protein
MYPRISVNWPQNFLGLTTALSLTNINLDLFAPECTVPIGFWAKYYVKMLLPLIIGLGAILTFNPARFMLSKCNAKHFSLDVDPVNRIISLFVALISRLNTLLISSALDPFHCSPISTGTLVLANDPSIQCYGSEWFKRLPIVIIFAFVYCVGVPIFLAGKLFQHREHLDDWQIKSRFGVLYVQYRKNCFWWDIVLMLKRAAFFMVLEITGDMQKGQSKVFLSISIILAFCAVNVIVDPFVLHRRSTLNIL